MPPAGARRADAGSGAGCMGCAQEAPPGLVVAEVLSVDDHPKADKLKVVEVDAVAEILNTLL